MRRIGTVLLIAVVLAGCGGGSSGGKPATSPTPTTSATRPTATVAQYASIIAENEAATQRDIAQLQGCGISLDEVCRIDAVGIQAQAVIMASKLTGAAADSSAEFIGPPPAEVAPLVAQTVTDARAVKQYAATLTRWSGYSAFDQLATLASRLGDDLHAWKPYGA